MKQTMGTVILTDERMAEARDAAAHLRSLGYRVVTPLPSLPLWEEEPLRAFAEPYLEDLVGVIHPAPERILGGVADVTEEDWDRAASEGPLAAWCVTKVFGEAFRRKKDGVLIYLNSIHAEKPVGRGALFSMGCAAVQMLMREANQDYAEDGVRLYFIQKGVSSTDPDSRSDVSELYCGVEQRYPQRKMPEEGSLNGLVAFLLTPEAAPLNGADLRADGGLTMYYSHRRREEGRERHAPSHE